MVGSIASSNCYDYQDTMIVPKGAISKMVEDLRSSISVSNNGTLINSKTGKPLSVLDVEISDETIRGFARVELMEPLILSITDEESRMQYHHLVSKIMECASIDDLKEYWYNSRQVGKPNALKTLLQKTGLYDDTGKNFTKAVSEWYSQWTAKLVEDDGNLARLNYLSDKEKQNCIDMSKKADSEEYVKYIQSLIIEHYDV